MEDLDDFVELAPAKAGVALGAISFSTTVLRGGVEKISLSLSPEAIAKLEGWPRFSIAWSSSSLVLRVRADPAGRFEAYKSPKGERYILRVDLPRELVHVDKLREPAPHRYGEDGRTVFITAPPAFRAPTKKALPAPDGLIGKPISAHQRAVEAARVAVPAPLRS